MLDKKNLSKRYHDKILLKQILLGICLFFSFFMIFIPIETVQASYVRFPAIFVEKNIVSVKVGQTIDMNVTAWDREGNLENFSITNTPLYSTIMKSSISSINITGNTLGIDRISVRSDSGKSKQITINVHDQYIFDAGDGLLIAYTHQFSYAWSDYRSYPQRDATVTFWNPVVPSGDKYEGFSPLGSLCRSNPSPNWGANDDNPSAYDYAIIIKEKNTEDSDILLKRPVSFVSIWNDLGSGCNADGEVWRPIAPQGYVALGCVVTYGYHTPSLDSIWCVRDDLAHQLTETATVGSKIWDDTGTGSDRDCSCWFIEEPQANVAEDGRTYLLPNTFLAAGNYNVPTGDNLLPANVLYISIPVVDSGENSMEYPFLTDYKDYEALTPRYFSSIYVPCTLLDDTDHSISWKIDNSPFYYVTRTETYQKIDSFNNKEGSQPLEYLYSVTSGFEQTETDTFSAKLGIKVTAEYGVEIDGLSGKMTWEISAEFQWTTQTSTTYSTSTSNSIKVTVPAGRFLEVLQVTTTFKVFAGNGGSYAGWSLAGKSTTTMILEYPRPNFGIFGLGVMTDYIIMFGGIAVVLGVGFLLKRQKRA